MKLLTIKETAKFLNRGEMTIRRLIEEGSLPAYRIRGSWMLKQEEIEEWLIKQKNITNN